MRRSALVVALGLVLAASTAVAAPGPTIHFTLFAQTELPLGQALWTGSEWLWNAENDGKIEVATADGRNVRLFAAFDQGGEEMRCAVPPNKFWPDGVYCHTPDNRIIRMNRDGSNATQLARLPVSDKSDGALTFDDTGRFGYALLAASGGSGTSGGQLFAVRKDGRVQTIGPYPGPGGAENIVVAPAAFGSAGGWCLLSIDQDSVSGRLLALDRKGTLKTIAPSLGNGANPLVVIRPAPKTRPVGGPPPGVYLADTTSMQIWFAPASDFAGYAGAILVGSELGGQLWVVRPNGNNFDVLPAANDLPQQAWNLEASSYVP